MRLRLLLPCAAAVAAVAVPATAPPSASAATTVRCTASGGVYARYRVLRGPSRSLSCRTASNVLLKGILNQRPPSGWRCRTPADRAWPLVETCDRRSRGRRIATAQLYATDDFFGPGAPPRE